MRHAKTLLACMAATLLFSCSKKDDDSKLTNPKPATSKLVGSWKITAMVADRPVYHWNTTEYVTDLWDREKDCIKDNLLIFDADSKVKSDEGATRCKDTDPQTEGIGTWKEDSGKLSFTDNDGDAETSAIDRLDDSTLVVTGERWYGINGEKHYYNATTTYRKQ